MQQKGFYDMSSDCNYLTYLIKWSIKLNLCRWHLWSNDGREHC